MKKIILLFLIFTFSSLILSMKVFSGKNTRLIDFALTRKMFNRLISKNKSKSISKNIKNIFKDENEEIKLYYKLLHAKIDNNKFGKITKLTQQMYNLFPWEWKAIINNTFTELELSKAEQLSSFIDEIENLTDEEWMILKYEVLQKYEQASILKQYDTNSLDVPAGVKALFLVFSVSLFFSILDIFYKPKYSSKKTEALINKDKCFTIFNCESSNKVPIISCFIH